jgi:hypothetical protein
VTDAVTNPTDQLEPSKVRAPAPASFFRLRLVPAALLMIFGALELVLVAVILGALLLEGRTGFKLFQGAGSPELSPLSLSGMALMTACGAGLCLAGNLIWRKRVWIGLIVAGLAYPLGVVGSNRMFSSPPEQAPPPTNSQQPQFEPPRFNNPRKPPPNLAEILLGGRNRWSAIG